MRTRLGGYNADSCTTVAYRHLMTSSSCCLYAPYDDALELVGCLIQRARFSRAKGTSKVVQSLARSAHDAQLTMQPLLSA